MPFILVISSKDSGGGNDMAELGNTSIYGDLHVKGVDVLGSLEDTIQSVQARPSSNSKTITVSASEPSSPKENDVWIVI